MNSRARGRPVSLLTSKGHQLAFKNETVKMPVEFQQNLFRKVEYILLATV
jgi:hypothetical protein